MDLVLLVLVVLAFLVQIAIGVPLAWALLIIVFFILLYLGARYPNGKLDWNYDIRTSVYILFTMISLIILIYLLYTVARVIRLPDISTLIIYIVLAGFIFLFLLALFFPDGYLPKILRKT